MNYNQKDKLNRSNFYTDPVYEDRPLAGKMSKVGSKILAMGSYRAKHLCSPDWELNKTDSVLSRTNSSFIPSMEKITSSDPYCFGAGKSSI